MLAERALSRSLQASKPATAPITVMAGGVMSAAVVSAAIVARVARTLRWEGMPASAMVAAGVAGSMPWATSSAEGGAAAGDLANFATGGATLLVFEDRDV